MMPENVRDVLGFLNEVDVTELKREGKDITFEKIQRENEELIDICRFLYHEHELWERIPNQDKESIRELLERYRDLLNKILRFSAHVPNPNDEKTAIIQEINEIFHKLFYVLVIPVTIWRLVSKTDDGHFNKMMSNAEEKTTELNEISEEAKKILENIRNASGTVGVSSFAKVFEDQAKHHERLSLRWFWAVSGATVVLLLVTSIVVYGVFTSNLQIENSYGLTKFLVVRILGISVVMLLFFQILKQYNTNLHLHTLNKHRQNTLLTFQTFVDSSNDAQIRDAILLQATKSIFDSGDTGYVRTKNDPSLNMETVRLTPSLPTKDS